MVEYEALPNLWHFATFQFIGNLNRFSKKKIIEISTGMNVKNGKKVI